MTRRDVLAMSAAVPAAAMAVEPEGKPLFDGKSLDEWTVVDGPESAFYVQDGAIVISPSANYPTWLRTARQYENFDFRCEVFIQGWANSGLYFQAPEYGRPTECGYKINLFQKLDNPPLAESIGAIFPVVAPRKVNVKNSGEWNSVRVLFDWPSLKVWINDDLVQDLDTSQHEALRYRRRSGYIGIESLSYPLRFRNLSVRELPAKERWTTLYGGSADAANWAVKDGKPKVLAAGEVLRLDGLGYLATKERYRDFAFESYIRASQFHNGGIIFRGDTTDTMKHYEIQLHDVEGAVYPTGSLYHYQRCKPYPRIEAERWYPFQLFVKDRSCVVRVNGDTVVSYDKLDKMDAAPIMLQAHADGKWIEYKSIRVKPL